MKTNEKDFISGIRVVREKRASEFGYDLQLIIKDAQQRDAKSDREVVRREPRRLVVESK